MIDWAARTGESVPRGPDKKLWVKVRQTLWDYEPLRASHAELGIEVRGGMVRLSGRVRTVAQKIIAEVLVKRLDGVEMVSNELIADPEVIRSVADALAADPRTAPYVIQVDARHGVVSLTGDVPDEATQQAAIALAAQSPLCAAVRDKLTMGGPTYDPYALTRASDPNAALTGAADESGAVTSPADATVTA